MARIAGVAAKDGGLFVRFAYFLTKRKVGRVVTPITIVAHHPRLLRALAQVKVAMLVGCPF